MPKHEPPDPAVVERQGAILAQLMREHHDKDFKRAPAKRRGMSTTQMLALCAKSYAQACQEIKQEREAWRKQHEQNKTN